MCSGSCPTEGQDFKGQIGPGKFHRSCIPPPTAAPRCGSDRPTWHWLTDLLIVQTETVAQVHPAIREIPVPRLLSLILAGYCLWAAPALAQTAAHCEPYQEQTIVLDLGVATQMTASAAALVGDTPTYAKWFGTYSSANAEQVRAVLKQVHAKLVSQRLAVVCSTKSDETCRKAFAWVLPATGVIRLCPGYFALPSMERAHQGADINYGSREGTLIHEISHAVAETGDECVSWADCRGLAGRSPSVAITSANTYESFAEDVKLQAMEAVQ
jgi:peptidyl-Lys metalloendopeptidase